MVSIVEVEIFGFLPFSNWPDFDQKWSKIGHFGPQMAQNQGFSNFLVSRRLAEKRPKESRSSVRPSVRPFVHSSRSFSKTVHYFFLKLCS